MLKIGGAVFAKLLVRNCQLMDLSSSVRWMDFGLNRASGRLRRGLSASQPAFREEPASFRITKVYEAVRSVSGYIDNGLLIALSLPHSDR